MKGDQRSAISDNDKKRKKPVRGNKTNPADLPIRARAVIVDQIHPSLLSDQFDPPAFCLLPSTAFRP
jgi:hypothetical protein